MHVHVLFKKTYHQRKSQLYTCTTSTATMTDDDAEDWSKESMVDDNNLK